MKNLYKLADRVNYRFCYKVGENEPTVSESQLVSEIESVKDTTVYINSKNNPQQATKAAYVALKVLDKKYPGRNILTTEERTNKKAQIGKNGGPVVIELQKEYRLNPDGVIGHDTWEVIEKVAKELDAKKKVQKITRQDAAQVDKSVNVEPSHKPEQTITVPPILQKIQNEEITLPSLIATVNSGTNALQVRDVNDGRRQNELLKSLAKILTENKGIIGNALEESKTDFTIAGLEKARFGQTRAEAHAKDNNNTKQKAIDLQYNKFDKEIVEMMDILQKTEFTDVLDETRLEELQEIFSGHEVIERTYKGLGNREVEIDGLKVQVLDNDNYQITVFGKNGQEVQKLSANELKKVLEEKHSNIVKFRNQAFALEEDLNAEVKNLDWFFGDKQVGVAKSEYKSFNFFALDEVEVKNEQAYTKATQIVTETFLKALPDTKFAEYVKQNNSEIFLTGVGGLFEALQGEFKVLENNGADGELFTTWDESGESGIKKVDINLKEDKIREWTYKKMQEMFSDDETAKKLIKVYQLSDLDSDGKIDGYTKTENYKIFGVLGIPWIQQKLDISQEEFDAAGGEEDFSELIEKRVIEHLRIVALAEGVSSDEFDGLINKLIEKGFNARNNLKGYAETIEADSIDNLTEKERKHCLKAGMMLVMQETGGDLSRALVALAKSDILTLRENSIKDLLKNLVTLKGDYVKNAMQEVNTEINSAKIQVGGILETNGIGWADDVPQATKELINSYTTVSDNSTESTTTDVNIQERDWTCDDGRCHEIKTDTVTGHKTITVRTKTTENTYKITKYDLEDKKLVLHLTVDANTGLITYHPTQNIAAAVTGLVGTDLSDLGNTYIGLNAGGNMMLYKNDGTEVNLSAGIGGKTNIEGTSNVSAYAKLTAKLGVGWEAFVKAQGPSLDNFHNLVGLWNISTISAGVKKKLDDIDISASITAGSDFIGVQAAVEKNKDHYNEVIREIYNGLDTNKEYQAYAKKNGNSEKLKLMFAIDQVARKLEGSLHEVSLQAGMTSRQISLALVFSIVSEATYTNTIYAHEIKANEKYRTALMRLPADIQKQLSIVTNYEIKSDESDNYPLIPQELLAKIYKNRSAGDLKEVQTEIIIDPYFKDSIVVDKDKGTYKTKNGLQIFPKILEVSGANGQKIIRVVFEKNGIFQAEKYGEVYQGRLHGLDGTMSLNEIETLEAGKDMPSFQEIVTYNYRGKRMLKSFLNVASTGKMPVYNKEKHTYEAGSKKTNIIKEIEALVQKERPDLLKNLGIEIDTNTDVSSGVSTWIDEFAETYHMSKAQIFTIIVLHRMEKSHEGEGIIKDGKMDKSIAKNRLSSCSQQVAKMRKLGKEIKLKTSNEDFFDFDNNKPHTVATGVALIAAEGSSKPLDTFPIAGGMELYFSKTQTISSPNGNKEYIVTTGFLAQCANPVMIIQERDTGVVGLSDTQNTSTDLHQGLDLLNIGIGAFLNKRKVVSTVSYKTETTTSKSIQVSHNSSTNTEIITHCDPIKDPEEQDDPIDPPELKNPDDQGNIDINPVDNPTDNSSSGELSGL